MIRDKSDQALTSGKGGQSWLSGSVNKFKKCCLQNTLPRQIDQWLQNPQRTASYALSEILSQRTRGKFGKHWADAQAWSFYWR